MEKKEEMKKIYDMISKNSGCYFQINAEYKRLKEKSLKNKNNQTNDHPKKLGKVEV